MKIFEIIVAVAKNNVIGNKGALPWGNLPRDLMWFKQMTIGHSVIVGSNTLLSMSRIVGRNTNILPDRRIYVLTKEPQRLTRFSDCVAFSDIRLIHEIPDRRRIFIAGGESIYRQFIDLPETRTIHLTKIFAEYQGDTCFPQISSDVWRKIREESHPADQENKHQMSFITLIKERRESD